MSLPDPSTRIIGSNRFLEATSFQGPEPTSVPPTYLWTIHPLPKVKDLPGSPACPTPDLKTVHVNFRVTDRPTLRAHTTLEVSPHGHSPYGHHLPVVGTASAPSCQLPYLRGRQRCLPHLFIIITVDEESGIWQQKPREFALYLSSQEQRHECRRTYLDDHRT